VNVSIIIPTLNEADHIASTIDFLRILSPHEILIVDGGSRDTTLERAHCADGVIQGPRGRAAQMNAGAAHASGDVLLFLHADCTLEPGALEVAWRVLARPGVAACCFQMHVTAAGWLYRMIDTAATTRVRWTGIAYGDQGLAVRREVFERIGGFPPLSFMEDVFISRRLLREGKLLVAPARIFVSDRRWKRVGIVRQTLRNWTLTALAMAGVHPDRLARFYPAVR
jgi:rSAM/selenodomain-associated transferase 2